MGGVLLAGGNPLGLLLPFLHAAGFFLAALLLVGYLLASRRVAVVCFWLAVGIVVALHWNALSMQYWYWKMLMTQWGDMPYVVIVPLTTVALLLSPAIRVRYRGDAAGVELRRAELGALELRVLCVAVLVGVAARAAIAWLFRHWDPETHLRFAQAYPTFATLLWTLALASPGALYAWSTRARAWAHRTGGGVVAGALAHVVWWLQYAPMWFHSVRSHHTTLDQAVVSVAFGLVIAGVYSGIAAMIAARLRPARSTV